MANLNKVDHFSSKWMGWCQRQERKKFQHLYFILLDFGKFQHCAEWVFPACFQLSANILDLNMRNVLTFFGV